MREKKGWIWIGILYVLAVLLYTFAVSNMTVPVHLLLDEDLYLSLAKSFHHTGSFQKGYRYFGYDCVLYPMLLSVAYFFYRPQTILFTLRLLNVLVMCSAVFPVYLLAKRMLPAKKAVMVCAFSLLIPDMIDTCYLMQEVLFYPVLMWCFYFVYRDLEEGKTRNRYCAAAALTLSAAFFVKTNGIVLIAAYCLLLLWAHRENKKRGIGKCLFVAGVWCVLTALVKTGVWFANGGNQGENHYASQLLRLLPIRSETVVTAGSGLLYYAVFFLLCTGVLPVVFPLLYRKNFSQTGRQFLGFCHTAILLMIAETVVTVLLPEETGNLLPLKFLFRYFFGFGIPLLIFLLQIRGAQWRGRRILLLAYAGTGLYCAMYYGIMKNHTRMAIMDCHVTLILENLNKYVFWGFSACIALLFTVLSFAVLVWAFRKKDPAFLQGLFWKAAWIGALGLCIVNMVQHPYYSNRIVDGKGRQADFITVAGYLGKEDIEVYYVNDSLDANALLYGYLWQDYRWVSGAEELAALHPAKDSVLVTAAGRYAAMEGYHPATLDTERITLWIRD